MQEPSRKVSHHTQVPCTHYEQEPEAQILFFIKLNNTKHWGRGKGKSMKSACCYQSSHTIPFLDCLDHCLWKQSQTQRLHDFNINYQMTQFKCVLLHYSCVLKKFKPFAQKEKECRLTSAASQAHHEQIPASYRAEASWATHRLKTVQKQFGKH